MIKTSFLLWIVISLIILPRYNRQIGQNSYTWQLVFSDEFSDASLNTQVWNTVPRTGRTDTKGQELQYYVDDAFSLSDGILNITAEKKNVGGQSYTSGLIDTRGHFSLTYGYVEIRAKMPKGKGIWPAFWMLPVDGWPPEIDIFEFRGDQPNNIYMSHHWADNGGVHQVHTESFTGPDFTNDFHTYGIKWINTSITWYVDGIERYQTTGNVPSVPMYVIANLAVGGSWVGYPDSSTPFPSVLQIDYIRAYELRPNPIWPGWLLFFPM